MATALIVEDGSNVTDANSYIDDAYLQEYAACYGFVIPTTEDQRRQFIMIAMEYIESFGDRFRGCRANATQSLSWPRENACVKGQALDTTAIPIELKKAVAQLVVEQQKGTQLYPDPVDSAVSGIVTHSKLSVMEEKYAPIGRSDNVLAAPGEPVKIGSVFAFLRHLIGGSAGKRTLRVI